MRLKLELVQPDGDVRAIAVTAEATATIGDVAAAIRAGETQLPCAPDSGVTLQVLRDEDPGNTLLPPRFLLPESGLHSGQRVRVMQWATAAGAADLAAPAELRVISGPAKGSVHPLYRGPNVVGRQAGCDVVLADPMASRRHARINIGEQVEVIDTNSA
ncbi:MAG: FHA domain-containing protein, partial [Propionibacteriaceae bacterium]|nr:FHA domain-containing protein [Propionibacteriaceae bacterium]